ncbi:MAG: GAF domain-containing protein [Candidatus Dormibacteraeota bacterium]|nr:GAF domain-containing protein [Candidatus Dormibacteraeota bacterium]
MLAEAPSHKPQARSDVGVSAWMAVPILDGERLTGLLLMHREGRPFGGDELDTVLRALQTQGRGSSKAISPLLMATGAARDNPA